MADSSFSLLLREKQESFMLCGWRTQSLARGVAQSVARSWVQPCSPVPAETPEQVWVGTGSSQPAAGAWAWAWVRCPAGREPALSGEGVSDAGSTAPPADVAARSVLKRVGPVLSPGELDPVVLCLTGYGPSMDPVFGHHSGLECAANV